MCEYSKQKEITRSRKQTTGIQDDMCCEIDTRTNTISSPPVFHSIDDDMKALSKSIFDMLSDIEKHSTALFIIGLGAVGKMSVGECICDRLGWSLLHNHQAIEYVFSMDKNDKLDWHLVEKLRSCAREHLIHKQKNMVITNVVGRTSIANLIYFNEISEELQEAGYRVCVALLTADYPTRCQRNEMEDRIHKKPSKTNLQKSREILEDENNANIQLPGEDMLQLWFLCDKEDIVIIDTTDTTISQEAERIIDTLCLNKI